MEVEQDIKVKKTVTLDQLLKEIYQLVEELERQVREKKNSSTQ